MKTFSWILAFVAAYFAPITGVCVAVAAAIIADTLIGAGASLKKGHKFKSVRLRTGLVYKMLIYQCVLLTVYLIDVNIFGAVFDNVIGERHLVTKAVAIVLISIEAISIDENFETLTGQRLSTRIRSLIVKAKTIKKDTKELL
jgi:hypothetical protein